MHKVRRSVHHGGTSGTSPVHSARPKPPLSVNIVPRDFLPPKTVYAIIAFIRELRIKLVWNPCSTNYYHKNHILGRHTKDEDVKRWHFCTNEGCGKKFKTDSSLRAHMSQVHGEKKYKCEEEGCGKEFRGIGILTSHYVTHTPSAWIWMRAMWTTV